MQRSTIFIVTICCLFIFLGLMPVHGEEEIYDSVLRLHVVANSDSEEDQSLKLKVRDAILNNSEELFSECKTRDNAIEKVYENIDKIEAIAYSVIFAEGYDYPVSVIFGEENYPTKNYESFCFPSGEYLSLRIVIGDGSGQNWWCVLYPPMCVSAASEKKPSDAFVSVGLNKDQYGIITENDNTAYKIRFKLLEVIEDSLN